MKDYIQLLRPSQWLKNLFVFLLLFFSGQLMTDVDCIVSTIAVFAAWCFAASAIYCFNDIRDMNDDRLHPVKRHRPLASGAISTAKAYIVMTCCLVAGLLFLLPVRGSGVLPVVLLYLLIDLAYSLRLKHVALLDVFILSAGFVLRILAGAFVSEVWISQWIVVMTFLLALFLSFAKRRDDLVIFNETGVVARRNISGYNAEFLNAALVITSTITIVAYIMYSVSEDVIARFGSDYVYTSSVFVILGILRYLQLIFVSGKGGNPAKICWEDRFIQLCIAGWLALFFIILYL